MQIVVRSALGEVELDLVSARSDATVRDLVRALDPGADRADDIRVDGRVVGADLGLDEAGVVCGSLIELGDVAPLAEIDTDLELAIVGGPDAGASHPIASAATSVGRGPAADIRVDDPTVSPVHWCLRLQPGTAEVVDLGSHNGTRVGGEPVRGQAPVADGTLVCFGAAEAVVRPRRWSDRPAGLDPARAAGGGAISFNRPPRVGPAPGTPTIPVPDPPAPEGRRHTFGLVTLVGPVAMGLLLVLVLGSLRYALFALMTPLLMASNAWAARRRRRRESTTSARQFEAALADFEDRLHRAAAGERTRRERELPDVAELVRRATLPSTRLWERRPTHPDHLLLRLGRGPVRWEPPVDWDRVAAADQLGHALADASVIPDTAVALDLSGGAVVGIVGDRAVALAVARSLVVQACTLHGPADLPVAVMVAAEHRRDWDWAKWLPHVRAADGGRRLSDDPAISAGFMSALLSAPEPVGGGLVVVDDPGLLSGRGAPARAVLDGRAGPIGGIVIASTADRLPSVCTHVVCLQGGLGEAVLQRPPLSEHTPGITVAGVAEATARRCARGLSRFEDPELDVVAAGLPARVTLLSLLGCSDADPATVAAAWSAAGADPAPATPLGVGPDGVVGLDLVADGPHSLVAGTTGAGKSELLRSLVAGMAARIPPTHLVFVLVDYKGGSAFDECGRLPHTVGLVTDLDEHLGERALVSLEAELHRRERILRAAGAADLRNYLRRGSPSGPLPRLVLLVDEFATLAVELPDFVGSLVGIAQRGRSLGVHMILATQRPSGVVSASIKANTNIRIALRVQDAHDSADVIDGPDAAAILRSQPGRAFIRLGAGEVIPVQTALSTATTAPGVAGIELRPFGFGPRTSYSVAVSSSGPSDLQRLVDACRIAAERAGLRAPRSPWLPMLPARIELGPLVAAATLGPDELLLGIADDPSRQRQEPAGWRPPEGHLALLGKVGSGTSTALVSVALAAALARAPDDLHIYALDLGGGALARLEGLPHVGAVVGASEHERLVRAIGLLAAEVGRRRDLTEQARFAEPRILLLVDGAPALLAELDGLDGQPTADAFARIVAEGAGVGVAVALSADRPMALPMRLLSSLPRRLMFRHADPVDFATLGKRPSELPSFVPGRAIDSDSGLVIQVPVADDVMDLVARRRADLPPPHRRPMRVEPMPAAVPSADLAGHLEVGDAVRLPVGIAEPDRSVALLDVHPGEHVLVAGQARSGVSTALRLLSDLLQRADPDTVTVAVAGERSGLRADAGRFDAVGELHQLHQVLDLAVRGDGRQWLVVVDDAHLLDEPAELDPLARRAQRCRLLVGGRADHLHGQFGHWTRQVRRSGTGLLLQPRLDADGDLLGVRLPRRVPVPLVPGRGFVVTRGDSTLVQVAAADLIA